jgi:hypothetical protein
MFSQSFNVGFFLEAIARSASRSISGTFRIRTGSGSYFGVTLPVKCLPEESWMP